MTFLFFAAALSAPITGADSWGMRESRPAIVNSVMRMDDGNTIDLAGEWSFATCRYDQGPRRNSHDNPLFADTVDWDSARKIRVPGAWEGQGVGDRGMSTCWDFEFDCSPKMLNHAFVGTGWYRRKVTIPERWAGKRIWIKIGGVNAMGWVWVNRRQVAHVANWCATLKYDITDCVKPGEEAEILVEADNMRRGRKGVVNHCHRWGGLYRTIELEATQDVWIDDVYIRTDFDRREARAEVEIGGAADRVETRTTFEIEPFREWTPESPNLYTAKIELVRGGETVACRYERFAFRKLEVRGDELYLNNRPLFLRGFGDDAIYPLEGYSPADREYHLKHLRQARAAGFNFVRLHTHCEVPEYFEAADEAGILVEAELPYINGDITGEHVEFDPVGDWLELYRNFRRHPSLAVYSNGNEGSFGEALDSYLYRLAKEIDPDRLKQGMDTQFAWLNHPGNSDYEGGPASEWPRGSVNPGRPFVCHEYLNCAVKADSREEPFYTGATAAPVTRGERAAFLAKSGLELEWGDRLQDAQRKLQAYWQLHGLASARADPYCDGYCFWTIVNVISGSPGKFSDQGLFDPFWNVKEATIEEIRRVNGPTVLLAEAKGNEVEFILSHYGEEAFADAKIVWRLVSEGKELAGGEIDAGRQEIGPARTVARLDLPETEVARPAKATLETGICGIEGQRLVFWLFPKDIGARRYGEVVVAEEGSSELAEAVAAGKKTISVGKANMSGRAGYSAWTLGREIDWTKFDPKRDASEDVLLGWWSVGSQVGIAIKDHPALKYLPHDGWLGPQMFAIAGKGRELPVDGIGSGNIIIGGESADGCSVFLAETENGFASWGLDLLSGRPEAEAMLRGMAEYLQ
ncbi:MAG: hypothetical protein ILO34_06635 [Kiritimatiellae bacterium]|nr:hypothetical protein [Kiritimatiellia bacterium]